MSDRNEDRLLDADIQRNIQRMPEADVPFDFSKKVMAGLEPKKPSFWLRIKLWLTGPMSLTFTPLQTVPALACVIALVMVGVVQMSDPVQDEGIRLTTIRFSMSDSNKAAQTVSVIGSFNEWKTEQSVMWYDDENGKWILEAQLPPGDHEYVFLVDGTRLVPDPQAAMTRDDGFGNKNSILFVNGDHEQPI